MNILLTSHRFYPHIGGTEAAVESLATAFAARGHRVTVATSNETGAPDTEMRNGFEIRRFTLKRVGKFRFPPSEYAKFVRSSEWDIVNVHGQRVWSSDYLYRHFGKVPAPIVFTPHGFYQWHMERTPLLDDAYYRFILPRALRNVARVTADTTNERDELIAWGVPADVVTLLPLGFQPDEFRELPDGFRQKYGFSSDEKILLYVGGFYANKRVDRLIEVAGGIDARLVIVGKDQDPTRGRAFAEQLAGELGARVSFLGMIPREDVLSGYKESDLFLLGADFEGFGLVLVEAMAAGLPFVSTPAGAAPDLASQGGGVIANDTAQMRTLVQELLADPSRRKALGEKGREAAHRQTWQAVAERYLALFEEVQKR